MTYEEMWNEFIEANQEYKDKDYSVYSYSNCDIEKLLNGTKTTEESLYDSFVNASEPLPIKGDVAVITDVDDKALCIIEDIDVKLIAYNSAKCKDELKESAMDENISLNDETMVICESFKVIYR